MNARSGWQEQRRGRIRSMLHRGHIVRVNNGDRQRYDIQTVEGSNYTDVEDSQPVGFTSNKRVSDMGEVFVAEVGGDASRMVIIAKMGDSEKHLQVSPGQMAIYSPDKPGENIIIGDDGHITINGSQSVTLNVPTVKINANVEITGNITHTGDYNQTGIHTDSNGVHI